MKRTQKNNGSAPLEIPKRALLETQVKQPSTRRRFLTELVFLMVIFVIALLAVLVAGMLQMNTEEIQVMRNQIYAAEALAIAEAGLNDAFAEIRAAGFTITEVVVASALLIIAIVPILKAQTSAHVTSTIIERRTRSLTLAQGKLDEIRARSIYNWGLPSSFAEQNTSLGGAYLCDVRATPVSPDLRSITVLVGCDLNSNSVLQPDEVEVTLSTLVAKRW